MSDRMQSIETNEHIRDQVVEQLRDEPRDFAELYELILLEVLAEVLASRQAEAEQIVRRDIAQKRAGVNP